MLPTAWLAALTPNAEEQPERLADLRNDRSADVAPNDIDAREERPLREKHVKQWHLTT